MVDQISTTRPRATEEEPLVLIQDDGKVRTLTLNRPGKFNAFSNVLVAEFKCALNSAAKDDKIRVIIIGASGTAYSTGHDLNDVVRASKTDNTDQCETVFKDTADLMTTINRQPQPVIARIQGVATAAGCQLVASCDLAIASSDARFATSGINVGLFCMTPSVALSRNVAAKHAFEMLTTGEFISAERAKEIGLINRISAPQSLNEETAQLAQTIAGKSWSAIKAGKAFFYKQLGIPLDEAYELATKEMALNMTFEDARDGINTFLSKGKS